MAARWWWLLLCLVGGCGPHDGGGNSASGENLLLEREPLRASGVEHPERLTDGRCPAEGDPWDSELAARMPPPANVVYDLGQPRTIDALLLIADNNDRFTVAISDDGKRFRTIWRAGQVAGAGMRARHASELAARGRYLRLTGGGVDRLISAGEVMAFEQTPEIFPPALQRERGRPAYAGARDALLGLCALLALFIALCDRRVPRLVVAVTVVPLLLACNHVVSEYAARYPVEEELLISLRALCAALGVLAALRLALPRARRGPLLGLLSMLCVVGIAAFTNLGHLWFYDHAHGRMTTVHTFDMRVYYPVAKYFDELRFDGLYLASVKAYMEGTGASEARIASVELRDLTTNQLTRARNVADQIERIDERFSPQRWEQFVDDMRYFWQTMGSGGYLGSLRDHGGNATPAWLALAHLLFAGTTASETTLTLTGLFDPLLLLATFVAIARTFGLRCMLLCLLVFGTTDFPMLGSNWAGSTLRFDWMAGVGLGVCALRVRRFTLAGVLLSYAAMVRAFPLFAIACAIVPLLARHLPRIKELTREPEPSPAQERLAAFGPELRLCAGALATVVLLFALSSALFGIGPAWGGWFEKITMHADKPNTNHVGVRTVMAYDPDLRARKIAQSGDPEPWLRWQREQHATYDRHAPFAWLLRLLLIAGVLWSCLRARAEDAALCGLLLIPVLFYPANYYLHYVFLLPMLDRSESERKLPWVFFVLCGLSVGQYFSYHVYGGAWTDERFFVQSVLLLCAYALIIAIQLKLPPRAASVPGAA